MKKFKNLCLMLFSLFSMFLFKGVASAATTYKLYEDSDGVRWQYAYIEDTDRVEISFFDNRNNRTSITIPSLTNLRSSDSDIPASATILQVENYTNHSLGTPTTQSNDITTINLSNANVINGVSPMINEAIVTTITFSSSVGTTIGNEAFMDYKLTINNLDKITSIGDRGFKNATLTYVNLTLSNLSTIGDAAFMGTNIEKVTSINTEKIEFNAFRDCLNLTSVKLGNNVKEIAAAAFQNAQKLTEINYNNVTKVGNFAFADCLAYNVDINNTKLTEIGDAAYSNTPSFKRDLVIPNGVTFLGWRVFYKSGITSVDLNNVEYLNVRKDKDYNNAGIYNYDSKTKKYITDEGEGETFAECANLSSVKFGKVWYLPYAAFMNDKKITKVDLSDNILFVHSLAFAGCNISELNLNKVQRIGTAAFANNKLTEVKLPKSWTYHDGAGMFVNNEITKVTIAYDTMSSNIKTSFFKILFDGGAMGTSFSGNSSALITDLIVEAPYKADEEVTIDSVFGSTHLTYSKALQAGYASENVPYDREGYKNTIKPKYFFGLRGVKNITIGEGYEYIGAYAFLTGDFSYNSNGTVEKVSLPKSLNGIGVSAFENFLTKDVDITLPDNLEYIGDQAFFQSTGFNNDFDSKNVKYIGNRAFQDSGIRDIYLKDKLEYIGDQAFYCSGYYNKNFPKNTRTIVFDLDIYSILNGNPNFHRAWGNQAYNDRDGIQYDLVKFTDKVKTEPGEGFANSNQSSTAGSFMAGIRAKEVDISETSWTAIGNNMFASAQVGKLLLPKNLKIIKDRAFTEMQVETPIEIPDSVTTIGFEAFSGGPSRSVKVANLPASLQTIAQGAFWNADFTGDMVIPEGVTSIGDLAVFGANPSLGLVKENVVINNNFVKSLGNINYNSKLSALFNGTKIKKITFGENVTELPTSHAPILNDSEFYNLGIEEAIFENLQVLPQKAFIDDTDLKKVTFKKGIEEIGNFTFYNTSLSEVNLPDNNKTIEVGYSAFRKTGLETIGDDNSGFNILANNIVTTGPYAFADNSNLKSVIIPDGFNNNIVGEYTFKNCDNLNKVDVYRNVETIQSEAFNGDYNFKKLFLWGDTKIEQNNVDEISEAGKIKIINTSAYYREKYEDNPRATLEFKINNSSSGQTKLNKTQIDYGYTYEYDGNGTITFEHPSEVTVNLVKTSDGYIANIQDVKETKDYGDFTVPAATDLYSYSTYEVKNWEENNDEYRRSEELGTDAKFYDLDEVIYLTSNHPKVSLTDNKKDFDKSKLTVYALRRDGVIYESTEWQKYTRHYARSTQDIKFEKYDSSTEEDAKMVYDIPYPAEEADISTENFKDMTFEIVESQGGLPSKEIQLFYTNEFAGTIVGTDIEPTTFVEEVVDKVIDPIIDTVNTGSGRVISTIIFLILSFLGLRFVILKKKKRLKKV